MTSAAEIGRLLLRIRSEFLEMPGLSLTVRQAARLWGMEGERCRALLADLAASGFLGQTASGAFVRRASR